MPPSWAATTTSTSTKPRGWRNAHRPRRIQTAEGELVIEVPQVRATLTRFVSSVIPDIRPLEALVSGAYVRGLSDSDIEDLAREAAVLQQMDDTHLQWKAEVGRRQKDWDAEITETRPDERVTWNSTSGARNAGVVTFYDLAAGVTPVTLQLDADPEDLLPQLRPAGARRDDSG